MSYLAVDKDGQEWIFDNYPERDKILEIWIDKYDIIHLPCGTIEKIIGRKLTWEDEPFELE